MTNKLPRSPELQKAVQELLDHMGTPTDAARALHEKQKRLIEALHAKAAAEESTPGGTVETDAQGERSVTMRLLRGLASVKNLPMAPDVTIDAEEHLDEGSTDK